MVDGAREAPPTGTPSVGLGDGERGVGWEQGAGCRE